MFYASRIAGLTFLLGVGLLTVGGHAVMASEIKVALSGDLRSSYPGVRRDSNSDDILVHVTEALLAHRGDLTIAPMVAEKYDVSEDFRQYTFTLRAGLLFHNGEPVLARHLKYNWEKILDPDTSFQCLTFYDGSMGSKIVSVEAPDDQTFVIQFDKPNTIFPEMLAYLQCPVAVLHPDSWGPDGKWLSPIGTGPYKLTDWKKGRYVLLEKFEGYTPRDDKPSGLAGSKKALVDSIKWVTITDDLAAKAAVVSGQIDLIYSKTPAAAYELRKNKRAHVMDSPGLARRALIFQTADPLLSNEKMRQAIAHALDLDTFAEVATFGLAVANPSIEPRLDANTPKAKWLAPDFVKARTLLSEAGYKGEKITLQTTRTLPALFDTAMIAEAMLKKAGLNISVEVLEWGTLIGNYFAGNFQFMAFEFSPRMTAYMGYQTLLGNKEIYPYMWDDASALQALIASSSEKDENKRLALYRFIHERIAEEVPSITLFNVPVIDITSQRLRGYKPWPGLKPRLWNVWVEE